MIGNIVFQYTRRQRQKVEVVLIFFGTAQQQTCLLSDIAQSFTCSCHKRLKMYTVTVFESLLSPF